MTQDSAFKELKDRKQCVCAEPLQSGLILCGPLDCNLPGSCRWDSLGKNTGVGLPCPPPRDLPNPGMEPASPASPALQADSLCTEPPRKQYCKVQ